MIFRLAFLNCYNLYPVEAPVDRKGAPKNQTELTNKIASLTKTIRSVFPGHVPDLIALSEVGSELIVRQLAGVLGVQGYGLVWSGISLPAKAGTGLVILYNPDIFGLIADSFRTGPPALTERHKWLATKLCFRQRPDLSFWLVANHWKSNMGSPDVVEAKQVESAQNIGQLYLDEEHYTTQAMILIGDFNCEPGDRAWKGQRPNRLVGARERAVVTRGGSGKRGNSKAYFYNPMWRRMGEPVDLETAKLDGYDPSLDYLMGTFVGDRNRVNDLRLWDQILVSKGLLTGSQIRFIESSLVTVKPDTGMSDHCALGARFEY